MAYNIFKGLFKKVAPPKETTSKPQQKFSQAYVRDLEKVLYTNKDLRNASLQARLEENVDQASRVYLEEIYKEARDHDAVVSSILQLSATILKGNLKIYDKKTRKENEELTKIVSLNDSPVPFIEDFFRAFLKAKENGFQGFWFFVDENTEVFDTKIMSQEYFIPQLKIFVHDPYMPVGTGNDPEDYKGIGDNYVNFSEMGDNFIPIFNNNSDTDLGFLNVCAKYANWSVYGQWKQTATNYGSPAIIAKSDVSDEKELDNLEIKLQNVKANGYVVTKTDDEIEQMFASGLTPEIYDRLNNAIEKAIYRVILGQTSTTMDNAHVGSSDIHKEVSDSIFKMFFSEIQNCFNQQFLPALQKFGVLPDNIYGAFEPDQLSVDEIINNVEKMYKSGHKISGDSANDIFKMMGLESDPDYDADMNNSIKSFNKSEDGKE